MREKKFLNILFFLVSMSFSANISLADPDNISGDFSGRPLEKVISQIAQIGKINFVGDFPAVNIPVAGFQSDVYYEEAINLVARSCGMLIRRFESIWLFLPSANEKKLDSPMVILKIPHRRSASSLEEPLRPLLSPEMKLSFPSLSGGLAMFGSKMDLDELKKTFETIDTPVHSAKIEFILKKGKAQTHVASGSFTSLGWKPFRLTFSPADSAFDSVDFQGLAGFNDDGMFHGNLRFEMKKNDASSIFSQSSAGQEGQKDGHWIDHSFEFLGNPWTFSFRGTVLQMNGKIMPLSDPARSAVPVEPDSFEGPSDNLPEGETISLEKPIVFEKAVVSEVIEKLAEREKIPVVCDAGVSGTISVYCFGDEVNIISLISAIAKVKGYDVFPNGNGLIIGERNIVRDMTVSSAKSYISPNLKSLSPASASRELKDIFRENDIVGNIEIQSGNRLQIKAEKNGLTLAKILCNIWSEPLPRFSIGVEIKSPLLNDGEEQLISFESPFLKEWKTADGAMRTRIVPLLADWDEGLRQVKIALEIQDSKSGRWLLQNNTNLPPSSSIPIFSSRGEVPIEVLWRGAIATFSPQSDLPPSPIDSNVATSAFDSSF